MEISEISFGLPFPPSTNSLFRGRRFKTVEYKAWREDAGWAIKQQNVRKLPTGDVRVTIELPAGKRRGDIDNRIKALLDVAVDMAILPDDRCVADLRIWWSKEVDKDYCRVTITPME